MKQGLIFLLLLSQSVFSDVKVLSSVDKKQVALNETFTFTVEIHYEGTEPEDISIPSLSDLQDFHVLNQWSGMQQSISIVNGNMQSKKVITKNYTLQAKVKGRLRLESFPVQVNGKKFATEVFFIEVSEKSSKAPPSSSFKPFSQSPGTGFLLDDFFDNSFFKPAADQKVFFKFRAHLDKSQVYTGEMIQARWVVYSSSINVQYQVHKTPQLKGFWREELMSPGKTEFLGTEVKDKTLYRKTLFDSQALFPLEPGELTVDSYQISAHYPLKFNWKKEIKGSAPRKISVKPLPSKGRGNFSGAVGDFKVKASLSAGEVSLNEPISYRLIFEGQGQVRTIFFPKVSFPSSLKQYDPVEKSQFSIEKSRKEFEVLLVPKKSGSLIIPSFELTTFNPKKGKYEKHRIPAINFEVKGEGSSGKEESFKFFKSPEDASQQMSFDRESDLLFNSKYVLYFLTFVFLFLTFAFFLLFFLKIKRKTSLRTQLESKFKKIEDQIQKKEVREASTDLINLIYFFLSYKISSDSSMDGKQLLQNLPLRFQKEFSRELSQVMEELEKLSFSPLLSQKSEPSLKEVKSLLERTERILNQMEAYKK